MPNRRGVHVPPHNWPTVALDGFDRHTRRAAPSPQQSLIASRVQNALVEPVSKLAGRTWQHGAGTAEQNLKWSADSIVPLINPCSLPDIRLRQSTSS
ncbi:hypothetical protein VTN77DRAFT_4137 [Rasamsonia byssochlamydoides]|uniref:uncharacterized protein n=1 Tax=Rasamsonia byssochlamydoides TaxID=89139 RepID=UPI0037426B4E